MQCWAITVNRFSIEKTPEHSVHINNHKVDDTYLLQLIIIVVVVVWAIVKCGYWLVLQFVNILPFLGKLFQDEFFDTLPGSSGPDIYRFNRQQIIFSFTFSGELLCQNKHASYSR